MPIKNETKSTKKRWIRTFSDEIFETFALPVIGLGILALPTIAVYQLLKKIFIPTPDSLWDFILMPISFILTATTLWWGMMLFLMALFFGPYYILYHTRYSSIKIRSALYHWQRSPKNKPPV